MPRLLLATVGLILAATARPLVAETLSIDEAATSAPAPAPRKHLIVAEAFGKLGLYSLGYELELSPRWSVGVAGAGFVASGRTVLAASAYVGTGGPIAGPHRWFVQAGPELVRESEPAVPGFDGLQAVGLGAQLTAGYEYRRSRWLLRGHAVVTAGRGGVAPWAGMSVGLRL